MRKILVTGSNGQLGQELKLLSKNNSRIRTDSISTAGPEAFKRKSTSDYYFLFTNPYTLDITRNEDIEEVIFRDKPDFVINCAAYTKVDKAEEDVEQADKVNALAPKNLAKACNEVDAVLIHLSSDYVYHCLDNRPLTEEDPLEPKSVYAKSKKTGEDNLVKIADRWIIIRTSWLYSRYGNNFVNTMLKLGRKNSELRIVNDQVGTPTYAKDLAEVLMKIVDSIGSGNRGSFLINNVFNFSNSGHTTWDAFARKIFEFSGIDCRVIGISTQEYGARAVRPKWSVLSKEKIEKAIGVKARNWEKALEECL